MDLLSFEDLRVQFQELFREGNYTEALTLVEENAGQFPEYKPLIDYWRIALYAQMEMADQALKVLLEVLQTGFWYGEILLRKSAALKSLQGLPEFERLVDFNQANYAADPLHKFPLLILRSQGHCEAGGPACPLMLALHTEAGIARDSVEFWQPAATAGWIVGALQSTQAMWQGAYSWNDYAIAAGEIKKHYNSLCRQYAVDESRVVLAGHSAGAETALRLGLEQAVPAIGVIAIGPLGPFLEKLENWQPLLNQDPMPDLRVYILTGEEDTAVSQEAVYALSERLAQAGVPCEVEEIPLAGHDYSPEYEAGVLRALEFIRPG